MEHTTLLRDLTILFGAAVLVSYAFRAARLSTITGFIVAGAAIGPFGLGLIASSETVRSMEEIGVILLLFAIGIEFSPERIRNMRRVALFGGGGQVVVTGTIAAIAAGWAGADLPASIVVGMVASLSSTVIGLRLLEERGQSMAPEGSVALGVLIFQDVAVLPMMLFLPFLRGDAPANPGELIRTLALSAGAVVLILIAARELIPRFIARTVRSRSRDLFILSVIVTVVGVAWASTRFGVSAGLGAFVAGLVISRSEYSHQVLSDVLPFRETFNSLFFVSIGMLLDPGFLIANAGWIALAAATVVIGKTGITSIVIRRVGYPWRVALGVGLLLSQIGEFSIVLLQSGAGDVLGGDLPQLALATILVTMILTPLTVRAARWLPEVAGALPAEGPVPMTDHTLVVGYGLNGRNVASLLAAAGLPYAILEMNPETVARGRAEGLPVFYGDAASESVLRWVGAAQARAVVFAISDPSATRRGVAAARRLHSDVPIIARTRYTSEIEPLYAAGATLVVAEEFETSLTIVRRLLVQLGIHPSKIDRTVLGIRQAHYDAFRGASPPPAMEIDSTIRMFEAAAGSGADGRSIETLALRARSGATIVAVERGGALTPNPPPDFVLAAGDRVHLIGSEQEVSAAIGLL